MCSCVNQIAFHFLPVLLLLVAGAADCSVTLLNVLVHHSLSRHINHPHKCRPGRKWWHCTKECPVTEEQKRRVCVHMCERQHVCVSAGVCEYVCGRDCLCVCVSLHVSMCVSVWGERVHIQRQRDVCGVCVCECTCECVSMCVTVWMSVCEWVCLCVWQRLCVWRRLRAFLPIQEQLSTFQLSEFSVLNQIKIPPHVHFRLQREYFWKVCGVSIHTQRVFWISRYVSEEAFVSSLW